MTHLAQADREQLVLPVSHPWAESADLVNYRYSVLSWIDDHDHANFALGTFFFFTTDVT